MEDILYAQFSGDYDITPKPDKKQQKIRNQIFADLNKVETIFGEEYLNNLFGLDGELREQQNFQYFRSGFLLCARLILVVLRGSGLTD